MATPLIITPEVRQALEELRDLAAAQPTNMDGLLERLKDPACKQAHMARMTRQTVLLPFGWLVTFSIETGHPAGAARHMSMSLPEGERVPSPIALWMVAVCLGFVGDISACTSWPEELQGHGLAINLVQLLDVTAGPPRLQ